MVSDQIPIKIHLSDMANMAVRMGIGTFDDQYQKLKAIYQKLGAQYVYSLVYRFHPGAQKTAIFDEIWATPRISINKPVSIPNELRHFPARYSHAVYLASQFIGEYDHAYIDLLDLLAQGHTIETAAYAMAEKQGHRPSAHEQAAALRTTLLHCYRMQKDKLLIL